MLGRVSRIRSAASPTTGILGLLGGSGRTVGVRPRGSTVRVSLVTAESGGVTVTVGVWVGQGVVVWVGTGVCVGVGVTVTAAVGE